MTRPSLRWEISAADPNNKVGTHCDNIDEVLDYCGRVLYGTPIFDVLDLRICHQDAKKPGALSDGFCSDLKTNSQWVMWIMGGEDSIRCRQLTSKHELLGMLLAELRLGAKSLEVRHISNVCEPLDDSAS